MLVTANLNEVGFFEGTEKLLEIWFDVGTEKETQQNDLRQIPRSELDALLDIVNAEIVSYTHNEFIDSYVLSESSMFISKKRIIIKTCGIIRLLHAVAPIIQLAKNFANMPVVQNFFYSRKVYLRPEEQEGVHKSFQNEVEFLSDIIPDGTAHVLGQKESEQWYLFTMDNVSPGVPASDVTLEILMSDLNEESMYQFTKMRYDSSDELFIGTGISRIIPGSVNDGLLFDPIGYSLNGLFEESYYTIHVTPQAICSYVSFETNLPKKNYTSLIDRVLSVFNPGKFIIILFCNKESLCGGARKALERLCIRGYECDDRHSQQLKNYSLAYRHYEKTPSAPVSF